MTPLIVLVSVRLTPFAMTLAPALAQVDFPSSFGTNLIMWSALVAQFLPPLIAAIVRQRWPPEVKAFVALLCCLIAALGVAYFQGNLDAENYATSALIVFTLATVMYRQFWKPSGIAPAIEAATG